MEIVAKLLTVGLILFVVWLVLQPRYLFTIEIADGKVRKTRGKVPAGFLEDVVSICGENKVRSGSIRALARGKRTSLSFSRQIPGPLGQKLRNAWNLHH
jgi:hypothetical protein